MPSPPKELQRFHFDFYNPREGQPTPTPEPSTPAVTPAPKRRNWTLTAVLVILFGGAILAAAIFGGWFLYNNPDIFTFIFGTTPIPDTPVAVLPTETPVPPAKPSPTEFVQTPVEPTATTPPTATPLPDEIKDDNGVPMQLVPAGEFTMGSDDSVDVGSRPAHTVYLDAFYIDKFEVTNEMYAECVEDTPECRRPRLSGSITRSTYYNNPNFANYPVLYVDWYMAKAYCTWRGGRLPTEAEWEKAARGTQGRIYPWESQERNCYYSNLAGCMDDTTAVDAYSQGRSPYGIYDLSGNVWEWTSSIFQSYPYDPEDGRENPTGKGARVARGGAWHSFGVQSGTARSDTRYDLDPSYYGAYVGMRCVMDIETE